MLEIEDHEARHLRALDEQVTLDAGSRGRRVQLETDAVPQIATRAPTASCVITVSLIGPDVLSK